MTRIIALAGAALIATLSASASEASTVYAAYSSTAQSDGVTARDGTTLDQSNYYPVGAASGIAANSSGFYVSNGDTLSHYDTSGNQLASFSFGNGINYSAVAAANGNLYATYNGPQQGVTTRDGNSLAQSSFFNTGVNATGITLASNGNIYLSAANSLLEYSAGGNLLNSATYLPDPSLIYSGISFGSGILAASFNSDNFAGNGVTIRDLALDQASYFNTAFSISGIAAGDNSDVYLASGNSLYHYTDGGELLGSETFSADPSVSYNAISLASVSAAPEPGTWMMMILGFGLIGGVMRSAYRKSEENFTRKVRSLATA